MGGNHEGGIPADVLSSLRSNPVLAGVSEEALARIAEMVAAETRAQVAAALREVELFEGLSNEDLERIQAIAEPVVLEAGARLFEEGDPDDRFFVVVRGEVELSAGGEGGAERVLVAGASFGETALLTDQRRTASARARVPSYLIALARDPFLDLLGGDSLAVRLLRNLSSAVQGAVAHVPRPESRRDAPREALAEYNRMVRGRLLPRGTPSAPGYDLSAATVADDEGPGAAAWDWFLLPDGRLALALLKVDQPGLSAAHRLGTVRALVRSFADDGAPDLGALLSRVSRGLRAGWVDGISGSVSCGVLALAEDAVEWVAAGEVGGTIVHAGGGHRDLVPDAPSLGSDDGLTYESTRVELAPGDRLLVFSDGPSDAVIVGRKALLAGVPDGARQALGAVLDRVRGTNGTSGAEVTAALVVRAGAHGEERARGRDALARAAAAYEAGLERDAGHAPERDLGGDEG